MKHYTNFAPAIKAVQTRERLTNIQVLRTFAAAAVVLCHSTYYLGFFLGYSVLEPVFSRLIGFYAIAVFFAISGFLMAGLVKSTDPCAFILHRAARIYPTYYVACIISMAVLSFFPFHPIPDLLGLSLVPAGAHFGPLGTEWTLVAELTFYMVLFLLALSSMAAHVEMFAVMWLVVILLVTLFAPQWQTPLSHPLWSILLASTNIPFVTGLLLPWLMKRATLWPLAVLIGIPLIAVTLHSNVSALAWAGGLSATLLVGAAAQMPQIAGSNWLSRLLIKLGDWSYVTYLLHCTVLWVVFQSGNFQHPIWVWLGALSGIAVVTAIIGPLDVALYRYLRRLVNKSSDLTRQSIAAFYCFVFAVACVVGVFVG